MVSAPARPSLIHVPGPWQAVMGSLLRGIRAGQITITMPDGRAHHFAGAAHGPVAAINVNHGSIARRVLAGGDIALAEGYMDGSWDTDDLRAVLDFGLANLSAGWMSEIPFVLRPWHRLLHAVHDNDVQGGSKRNVAYHYDLGNDFYRLWLDDTMTYSAAMFDGDSQPPTHGRLEEAQRRKWDRVLELVQPGSGDHILEIGCGWGGFAVHAAQQAGCRVTGLTLSEEQATLARDRVEQAGLEGRIDIRVEDYRSVSGTYDGIASIEMFEAVGEKWWPVYFERIRDLLTPRRAAGMQVITIAEDRFEAYKREPDFTQRYIFPGGMLPSPERFLAAARGASLSAGAPRFFGRDYATTLSAWAERFEDATPQVRALGFDERFVRMWRYYLAYCTAGFTSGNIDVMQVRLDS